VQSRPEGVRVRIIATRERALAGIANGEVDRVSRTAVKSASTLAVHAVRAVPELRWAVVDTVVRPRRLAEGRAGACLVEGLSLNPETAAGDRVVGGNLESFYSWLLGAA